MTGLKASQRSLAVEHDHSWRAGMNRNHGAARCVEDYRASSTHSGKVGRRPETIRRYSTHGPVMENPASQGDTSGIGWDPSAPTSRR